jgi:hypothetical protein
MSVVHCKPYQGGLTYHTGASVENLTAGALNYVAQNDPKASLLMSFGWLSGTVRAFAFCETATNNEEYAAWHSNPCFLRRSDATGGHI